MIPARTLVPGLLLFAAPLGAQIQPDDILVNYFGSGGVEVYRPDGTLVMASGAMTGSSFVGVVQTTEGLLATSYRSPVHGIDFLDATGTEVRSFTTPEITSSTGDLNMFSDGTLAMLDQGGGVDLYDPLGAHLGTIQTPGISLPFGGWIDGNDHLWVIDHQTGSGTIERYDRAGNVLGTFTTPFDLGDLVVAPDGTLWVSGRTDGRVYHMDAAGSVLSSFPAISAGLAGAFYGIALGPDGTIFAIGYSEGVMYRYDPLGNLLGSFPVAGSNPTFIRAAGSPSTGITGTPDSLSVSLGGSQVLSVDVDDAHAGRSYLVLGTASGTEPGLTYTGVVVPLNVDAYLVFTLLNPNTPLLNGSGGVLNSLGQATAVFTLPPGSDPGLVGLGVDHAAVVLDLVGPTLVVLESTGTAPLTLAP